MIGALAAWGCSLPNQDLPLPGTPFSNLARGNPAFFPQRCGLHEGGAIISAEFQRRQPIDIHLDATNDYAGSGKETLRRLDAGMIPKCEIWIACLPQIATNATTYGVTFGAMIN